MLIYQWKHFKNKYNMGRSNQRFEKYMEIVLEKFLETKMVIKTAKTLELGNFFRKFKLEFETNFRYHLDRWRVDNETNW